MNVSWELFPYDADIPLVEIFDLVWIYPERPGLSGDGGLELVVAEGFERLFQARV